MDMDRSFKIFDIDENSTPKEIGSMLYDHLSELGWLYSYNYKRKEPKLYSSKEYPKDLKTNLNFTQYAHYILYTFLNEGGDFELSQREFNRYNDKKGISCVYYSVLLYLLLKEEDKKSDILKGHKMKYVQGFYKHPLRKEVPDMLAPLFGGKTQLGIHAFLTIDDVVFDFTITQQTYAFNLDQEYVMGDIPNGLEYYGFEESLTIVDEYWKRFAKEEKMHPKAWLLKHQLNALHLLSDSLEKLKEEL